MKAVSIHQPWAHAILHLGKDVENRTWRTNHRGPLLVHASKSLASYARQDRKHWRRAYGVELPEVKTMTFGAIIGVVDVVGCVELCEPDLLDDAKKSVWAEAEGFGWILENPRAFPEPVTFRGAQLIFEVPDNLIPQEFRS
jgi:hypothetical protein